jgi:hypothetical protein
MVIGSGTGPTTSGAVWLTGGEINGTNALVLVSGLGTGSLTVSNGVFAIRDMNVSTLTNKVGTYSVAGGTNTIYRNLIVGSYDCLGTGVVNVVGGRLFVTNTTATAVLEVRSGTLTLNSGILTVDRLVITNACGHFVKAGGALNQNSPAVLGAGLDADGDGLPNDWEVAYGLDPLDGTGNNGANGDPDGDGLTNLQEYLAGSNPVADIKSIKKEANDIRVTWQAAAAKTNALQRSPGSNGSYSNNFADIFIVTNNVGSVTNYLDSGAATTNLPALYYRVRLVP